MPLAWPSPAGTSEGCRRPGRAQLRSRRRAVALGFLAGACWSTSRHPVLALSEGVEAPLEQAELVAFWIDEDVPGRLRGLADVHEFGPGGQQALELGLLIAVGGVEVYVQPGMLVLRLVVADEEDCRLRSTEPFAWAYLD